MMRVDTHVHLSLTTDEPVEILLAQLQHNAVDKAVLVQRIANTDNSYLVDCARRFPGRFAVVCRVDSKSHTAVDELERWHREGAAGVRLKPGARCPGDDPLAIWKKAQELGMPVSVAGSVEDYASADFEHIVQELPELMFVFEHLCGMGLFVLGTWSKNSGAKRAPPSDADYRRALALARHPNTYIKVPGLGEISPGTFPYQNVPPYLRMAYDAFGPERMMWGSDWPPVTQREGYRSALRGAMAYLDWCGREELDWIFGGTALSVWCFS
jgi:L-fuconolactonase